MKVFGNNKRYLIAILVLCLSIPIFAQNNAWFTSKAEAIKYATEKNLPVMMVFAGSDWCKPCMMLKHDILLSANFQEYFPEHFSLLYLDFPMQKKNQLSREMQLQNEQLAEKYNRSGMFPCIVVVDTKGKMIGNLTYKHQNPDAFIEQCNQLIAH